MVLLLESLGPIARQGDSWIDVLYFFLFPHHHIVSSSYHQIEWKGWPADNSKAKQIRDSRSDERTGQARTTRRVDLRAIDSQCLNKLTWSLTSPTFSVHTAYPDIPHPFHNWLHMIFGVDLGWKLLTNACVPHVLISYPLLPYCVSTLTRRLESLSHLKPA